MKKKLSVLTGLFCCGIVTVWLLWLFSYKTIHEQGSFLRLFPPHVLDIRGTLDIIQHKCYIAGSTGNSIYIANREHPLQLFIAKTTLTDSNTIKLKMPGGTLRFSGYLQLTVDSPYYYLADGGIPAVWKGNFQTAARENLQFHHGFFDLSVPICQSALAFRGINGKSNEYIIGRETMDSPWVKLMPGLLEKQGDGFFSVDGNFSYDHHRNCLAYVYFYRNQFIYMDCNLHVLYKGNTIDTNSTAKVRVGEIKSERKFTLLSPPLLVNKKSCLYDNHLYIQSMLMARNEDQNQFDSSSVIDVYDIDQHAYHFSFYLTNYAGQKLTDFFINGDQLIALFDHYLQVYKISGAYLKN